MVLNYTLKFMNLLELNPTMKNYNIRENLITPTAIYDDGQQFFEIKEGMIFFAYS